MPKTKNELIQEINEMLEKLKVAFKYAGKAEDWVMLQPDKIVKDLSEGYKWLKAVIEGPFKDWQSVYRLQGPERWERYKIDPDTYKGFPEVNMMKTATRKLLAALRKGDQPSAFKKNKIPKAPKAVVKGDEKRKVEG